MIFEEFLKDVRKQTGLTQQQIADKCFLTHKAIANYEHGRRQCTFDLGMNLLNAMGVSVIIENNEIRLKDGAVNMDKTYVNDNLDFINLNTEEVRRNYYDKIKQNKEQAKIDFKNAYDKLISNDFEVTFQRQFDETLYLDEFYDGDTILLNIKKDEKEIVLEVTGYNELKMFNFESFIDDFKKVDEKVALFVEKTIMFYSMNEGIGYRIFEGIKSKNKKLLLEAMPLVTPYIDIIMDVLNKKDDSYIFALNYGYDPEKLTISNGLDLYDTYSTPYIFYGFVMDDGEIVYPEESFEGHDIMDALSYAIDYFEDYESYKEMYQDDEE